jgi:predicted permease
MLKDLRHAVRMLLQAKGWTTVVVLSLALGIGANTALFSAVNGLLLRTIPVRDPHSLVRLRYVGPNDMVTSSSDYGSIATPQARTTFSFPMYQQFVAANKTMTDLVACAPFGRVNVVVDGAADVANAFISTGNYYRVLGVGAQLGRVIGPDDDKPGAPPVAVISGRFWRTRFAADPKVVGRTVSMNNTPVTIVGVVAESFTGIQQPLADLPDVSFPLALDGVLSPPLVAPPNGPAPTPRLRDGTDYWLQVMGRLKPDVRVEQVEANLSAVFQNNARAALDNYLAGLPEKDRLSSSNTNRTKIPVLRAEPGARGVYDPSPDAIRSASILAGVVVLVLLIVCANVANLLLSRAATRQKEISIRLSMGATRGRLIRQMLTESLLLSAIGGAFGLVLAYWLQQMLPGPSGTPTLPDATVLGFVLVVTGVTGVVFGIAPALRGTQVSVSTALKEQSRSVVGSKRILSKVLLVAQVAISLVLLVGAALFLRTLDNLRRVDVGFNPANLVMFTVNPQLNRYETPRVAALYGELLEKLKAVPGV